MAALLLAGTAGSIGATERIADPRWENWHRVLYAELWADMTAGTGLPDAINPSPNYPHTEFRGRLAGRPGGLDGDGFFFDLDLSFLNDGRYGASQSEDFYGGFHFRLNEGGLGYRTGGLQARAGRYTHRDALDSPYSLFINSLPLSAMLYEIQYEGGFFTAETRAIELNRNSAHGFPDRGATYKRFSLNFGNWEVGYQDSIVSVAMHETWVNDQPLHEWERDQLLEHGDDADFDPGSDDVVWRRPPRGDGTGPYFVPEYFFSPIPSFLLQYVTGGGEKPFLMDHNHTSIMGFYTRYQRDTWELQAQWLVDDINFNRFLPDGGSQNPDKMGWMLGGRLQTRYGRFGLWHGGATRYTFQPYGRSSSSEGSLNRMYGYTYYPAVEYPRSTAPGGMQAIPNRENNIGLYLGENSAGFRLDWDHQLLLGGARPADLDLRAGMEFTLTGSQSPANPWGEYTHWAQHDAPTGTRYLDDDVLEKGIIARVGASWQPHAGSLGGFGSPLGSSSASRRGDASTAASASNNANQRGWGSLKLEADLSFGGWLNVLQLEEPRIVEGSGVDPDDPANSAKIWYPSDENSGFFLLSLGVRYGFGSLR